MSTDTNSISAPKDLFPTPQQRAEEAIECARDGLERVDDEIARKQEARDRLNVEIRELREARKPLARLVSASKPRTRKSKKD